MSGPATPRVTALAAVLAEDPVHPWERQAGETEEEYELFTRYRDRRPPRGRVIGPGMGNTAKVFKMFQDLRWTERVAAWDRYLGRIELEARAEFVAKSARDRVQDHLALLSDGYELALLELRKLLQRARETDMPGAVIKTPELIKLIDRVVTLERAIHGQATEVVEHKGPDLSALSLDEIDKLEELLSKAGESAGEETH